MPKPLEPPSQDHEVQIKHQYHAFLVANVSIHDLGKSRSVEVGLAGRKYAASASLEATRAAPNLTGLWRATFYVRTKSDATLDHHLNLRRMRTVSSNFADQPAFWTCTGAVHHVDAQNCLLEVRVSPSKNATSRFHLTTRISPDQIQALGNSPFVHLTGTLENHQLLVTNLEARAWVDSKHRNSLQQIGGQSKDNNASLIERNSSMNQNSDADLIKLAGQSKGEK